MPQKVHDCVESVLGDNPDMDESQAWAICRAELQAEAGDVEIASLDDLGLDTEALDEFVTEVDAWTEKDGVWVNHDEMLVAYDPAAVPDDVAQQQPDGFAADVFRIVQDEDGDMDLKGDLMGVGVDFPNAGVYVDWRIDAWPDDEQLNEPHVSDYGSIDDLEQATGDVVEHLETVEAVTAGDDGGEPDQQAVLVRGLSQEAQESLARRHNVEIQSAETDG